MEQLQEMHHMCQRSWVGVAAACNQDLPYRGCWRMSVTTKPLKPFKMRSFKQNEPDVAAMLPGS